MFGLLFQSTPGETIQTLKVVSGTHPIDMYSVELLSLIIDHRALPYQIEVIHLDVAQLRAQDFLLRGATDVYWSATTLELEEKLYAVYFPLFKGLLGYRISLINTKNKGLFDDIKDIHAAREIIYGQMGSWTDTRILSHNHFKVLTTPSYESLFVMLDAERFDAFPRGIFEPWNEISRHSHLNLAVEQNLAFSYTMPFYFFVHHQNKTLAEDLKTGLDSLLESGEFDKFLYSHPLVQENLKKAHLDSRLIFRLINPELSDKTPLENKNYWYQSDQHSPEISIQ